MKENQIGVLKVSMSGRFLMSFIVLIVQNVVFGQTEIKELSIQNKRKFMLEARDSNVITLDRDWVVKTSNEEKTVSLPCGFSTTGLVTFSAGFRLPSKDGIKTTQKRLYGEGIWTYSRIYVNGNLISKSRFNYFPFEYDIPEDMLVYSGENTLTIEVTSESDSYYDIPAKSNSNDPKRLSGVLAPLFIHLAPHTRIESVFLTPVFNDTSVTEIDLSVRIASDKSGVIDRSYGESSAKYSLWVDVMKDGILVDQAKPATTFELKGRKRVLHVKMPLKAPLLVWSLGQHLPHNYVFRFSLVDSASFAVQDRYEIRTGFSKPLKVNSLLESSSRLRGMTLVGDAALTIRSNSFTKKIDILKRIKELGTNTILFDTQVLSEWLYLCDSLGLQSMIKLPLRNQPDEVIAHVFRQGSLKDVVGGVISKTRNHPSVIGYYVIENASNINSDSNKIYSDIYRSIKSETSKLVVISPQNPQIKSEYSYCDAIGIELPAIQKLSEINLMTSTVIQELSRKKKPFIFFNLGPLVQGDNKNGYYDMKSEDHQAKYFVDMLSIINEQKNKSIYGYFIGSLFDYQTVNPQLILGQYGSPYISTNGLMSFDLTSRKAYHFIKAIFEEKPFSELISEKYEAEPRYIFTVFTFILFFAFVTILNARLRIGYVIRRSVFKHTLNLYMDIREKRLHFDLDSLLFIIILSFIWGISIEAILYALIEHPSMSYALSHFLPNGVNLFVHTAILSPGFGSLFFAALSVLVWFMVILFFRFLAIVSNYNSRGDLSQYSVAWVWCCSPWLIFGFIPIMIERVEFQDNLSLVLILSVILFVISLFRYMVAIGTIEIIYKQRLYFVFVMGIASFFGVIYFVMENIFLVYPFVQYWLNFK